MHAKCSTHKKVVSAWRRVERSNQPKRERGREDSTRLVKMMVVTRADTTSDRFIETAKPSGAEQREADGRLSQAKPRRKKKRGRQQVGRARESDKESATVRGKGTRAGPETRETAGMQRLSHNFQSRLSRAGQSGRRTKKERGS